MNIFQKISLLWRNKDEIKAIVNAVEEVKKEAEKVGGIKAGWKTTEFSLALISILTTLFQSFQGHISAEHAATISALLAGVYSVLRTLVKK